MRTRTDPLTVAIRDLTDRHQSPPCRGTQSHLWTSDHAKERAQAATMCTGCPIIDVCREESRDEPWWVWAGVDHSWSTSGARTVRHGCTDCGKPLLKTRIKRCKDCHIESTTKETCKRGHLRTPDNVTANRSCRQCQRDRRNASRKATS